MKLFVVNSEAECLGRVCSSLEGVFTSEQAARDFVAAQDRYKTAYLMYECVANDEGIGDDKLPYLMD